MKRLTEYTIPETGFSVVSEEKYKRIMMDNTFIVDQLDSVFSKIKIIDGSVDKDELHCQLLDYYRAKFGNPDLANFHYEFIDLFCGAGGLSVGLEQEGFRPVVAVDKDRSAILTYRFNRPWLTDANIATDHEGGASFSINFGPDDFCSYGQRKEADHD